MKRDLKIFLFIITVIINTNILNASCEEAKDFAQDVEFVYSKINNSQKHTISLDISKLYYDELYVVVTNNYNDKSLKFTSEDKNEYGYISFYTDNINESITYNLDIYSKSCSNNKIRSLTLTTPKYNSYSERAICEDKIDKIDECDPFYDVENITWQEFDKLVNDKIHANKKMIINFIKTYYLFFLIPFVIISLFYITRIIIIKRRNKNA